MSALRLCAGGCFGDAPREFEILPPCRPDIDVRLSGLRSPRDGESPACHGRVTALTVLKSHSCNRASKSDTARTALSIHGSTEQKLQSARDRGSSRLGKMRHADEPFASWHGRLQDRPQAMGNTTSHGRRPCCSSSWRLGCIRTSAKEKGTGCSQ